MKIKKLSLRLLSVTVVFARKQKQITQADLSRMTGINRSLLSRLESQKYAPSADQLYALSQVLGFDPAQLFIDEDTEPDRPELSYKIAVAGTGYVGLSLAVLLAQHNEVTAVDIIPEKAEKLARFISPIQDDYIEQYLAEAREGTRILHLSATTDGAAAYADADFVIVAAPTNYDPRTNFFDCSAVEAVLCLVTEAAGQNGRSPVIVIKSTVPVGFTAHMQKKFPSARILFSPEFLRESRALYDNLYPSRIIVGCDDSTREEARVFAALLQQGALKPQIE